MESEAVRLRDENVLLRMEVKTLKHSRDEWKVIAEKYESVALSYKALYEAEKERKA